MPQRASSTARIIASRPPSQPTTLRRGWACGVGATSAYLYINGPTIAQYQTLASSTGSPRFMGSSIAFIPSASASGAESMAALATRSDAIPPASQRR